MMRRGALLGFLVSTYAGAAELKSETLAAWDDYIHGADQAMQDRLAPGRFFLWTDEIPSRAPQLKAGTVLATPSAPHVPRHVASGLIHHWVGAAFIPDASVDDVLAILRGYARYKEFYTPAVFDSKSIRQDESGDQFSLVLMNKVVVARTALDTEEQSRYVRVNARRVYGISQTTRIQEIQNFGQASECRLPPDQGTGYIWRLHTITRLEERDGGVYLEVEALALSRDIPAAFRFVVEPIVKRVSKSSLTTSLRQTQDAVASTRSKTGLTDRLFLLR